MALAALVHRNGLAECMLCVSMKRRISSRSSLTLVMTPRRSERRSNCPSQVSTALIHDALVGVKRRWKRGRAARKSRIAPAVYALLLSTIRCSAAAGGVARSICEKNCRNSVARWRRLMWPRTSPVATLKAAYCSASITLPLGVDCSCRFRLSWIEIQQQQH